MLLDDAVKLATPLTNGTINETPPEFALACAPKQSGLESSRSRCLGCFNG